VVSFRALLVWVSFTRAFFYFYFQIFMRFQQSFFGSFRLRDIFQGFHRADNAPLGIADHSGGETQPSSPFTQFREKSVAS